MIPLVLFIGLAAQTQTREDHLEPAHSVFGDGEIGYHRAVAEGLLSHANRNVQMLVLPPFSSEYAVYVVSSDEPLRSGCSPPNKCRDAVVIAKRANESVSVLHRRLQEKRFPPGSRPTTADIEALFRDVLVRSHVSSAPIDEDTVALLDDLWNAALLETRFATTERLGVDGTYYYFADSTNGFGYRVGKAWSPEAGTKLRALVEVGEQLFRYASTNDRPASLVQLRASARSARSLFAATSAPPQ